MTDSNGCGDPIVTIDGVKDQVTYSRAGVPFPADAAYISHDIQQANVQDGDNAERTDAIDIIVYFPDKTGVQLKVRDGQNVEAGELFELVMGVMEFPGEARESFSLWLVSDLLELQLKPTHVPFKLVCYWEELLEKYTAAPEEHLERDEPVIMFKRNVFNSREAEKSTFFSSAAEHNAKLTGLLRYLYWEAKKNVLDGRYPFSSKECDAQAGIQAWITLKEMETDEQGVDAGFGTAHYFKSHVAEYLPAHFCKRHWIRTKENPENRIANAYNDKPQYCNTPLHKLYEMYLDLCLVQPYYGSAFFRGQAEHPVKGIVSKVLSTKDDPVYVAVNVDGVFIIDMDDFTLLIGIYFENLSWQFVESEMSGSNPNCLPCLFLQFPDEDDEDNRDNTKLLQIFSRKALLMDNLIEACVELKKTLGLTKAQGESHIVYGKGDIAETFKRLAFMKFSREGKELQRTIRRPKQMAPHPPATPANV